MEKTTQSNPRGFSSLFLIHKPNRGHFGSGAGETRTRPPLPYYSAGAASGTVPAGTRLSKFTWKISVEFGGIEPTELAP